MPSAIRSSPWAASPRAAKNSSAPCKAPCTTSNATLPITIPPKSADINGREAPHDDYWGDALCGSRFFGRRNTTVAKCHAFIARAPGVFRRGLGPARPTGEEREPFPLHRGHLVPDEAFRKRRPRNCL